MPWIPVKIVLRNFYRGLFSWCKQSLYIIAEEGFLECSEEKSLDIINGLSNLFVYDCGFDVVMDRLDSIEERLVALNIRGVVEP